MGENETRFLSLSGQGFQLIRGTVMAEKKEFIRIRGARENNLKALNVDIPRNQFVVFTGLSGSGKSSLAFDTIYAEGQRRYMESLSSYARQFLGQMEKPNVDSIEGLPPAISIDQKSTNRNPRSTVGTVTEIYDYFRLLYARIGIPHCPKCGKVISRQSVDQMVDQIMALPERTKIQLLAPVVRGRKGRHEKVLEQAKRSGYVRVMIDGSQYELSEEITLDKNLKHNISIIVDRLVVKPDIEKRLTDSVENVLDLADGLLVVDTMDGNQLNFSQSFSCPDCGISMEEIEPRSFSFNNPFGACPSCAGLGYKMEFDEDLMIPDKTVSIADGAITVLGWQSCTDKSSYTRAVLDALAEEYDFSLSTPFCEYPKKIHDILIYGTNGKSVKVHYRGQRGVGVYDVAFEGLIKNVERRYRETGSDSTKQEYETFMRVTPCQACHGQRLKPTSLGVTVGDKNIFEVTSLSIDCDHLVLLRGIPQGKPDQIRRYGFESVICIFKREWNCASGSSIPFFIHISLLIFSVFTPFLLRFPHFPLPRPIQLPLPLLLSPFLLPAAHGVPLPLAQWSVPSADGSCQGSARGTATAEAVRSPHPSRGIQGPR